ncbi:hypothetical protein [Streptomyces sp. NPDC048332]|uniref:hypothetical protein n=1 Tax=Streptomyces sp. NPDC048332 TaxID=3154619 RepID=UPI003424F999
MPDAIVSCGLVFAVGLALVLATTYTRGHQAPMPGPDGDRTNAPPDSVVYAPCDWVDCGAHRSTPQDITVDGLTCRECGRGPQ